MECEHENTEYEPYSTGLTVTYEPTEIMEKVCQICGEILTIDPEDGEEYYDEN